MLNGGYVMLDLTPYKDGDTSLALRKELEKIITKGKPICVLYNTSYDAVTPIYASLVNNSGVLCVTFLLFDEHIDFEVSSDGTIEITTL